VSYLYARLRDVSGATGRRVVRGESIGLSGASLPSDDIGAAPWLLGPTEPPQHDTQTSTRGRPNSGRATTALPPGDPSGEFRTWSADRWIRHYGKPSGQMSPRMLVDDRRWPTPGRSDLARRAPQRRGASPAALVVLLALPLLVVSPVAGLAMLLLASLSGRGQQPVAAERPPAIVALGETEGERTVEAAADSWLVVTLPPLRAGQSYRLVGGSPPLAPTESVSESVRVGAAGSTYAVRLGVGVGTLTFQLVRTDGPATVLRAYTLHVRAT